MIFPLMETITFALQTIYKTLNKLFESNAMVENFLYEKKKPCPDHNFSSFGQGGLRFTLSAHK